MHGSTLYRWTMTIVGALAMGLWITPAIAASANTAPTEPAPLHGILHADQPGPKIDRNIYGQFAEHLGRGIYEGIWVGEDSPIANTHGYRNDVLAALKHIHVPVIRWPGGCFADDYNWRDGIGPRAQRPVRVNALWGGVTESNAFGSHEFLEFTELVGARSYLSIPVGAGSPLAMEQWLEYLLSDSQSTLAQERRRNGRDAPFKIDYLGVGNESWGCGGQMRPEHYVDEFRDYTAFVRAPAEQMPKVVASGAADDNYRWTEVLMADPVVTQKPLWGHSTEAISLHYYTVPSDDWDHKGPATGFSEEAWARTLSKALHMEELVAKHSAIMDKYDPERRLALYVDEWGAWYDQEPDSHPGFLYQQNSLRDALVAALTLNIFHAHAERVRMANIAQMINVLQAMILTRGEKLVLTPTYHVFDLYQVFQDATRLPLEIESGSYTFGKLQLPQLSATAARGSDGVVHIALANLDPQRRASLSIAVAGLAVHAVSGRALTSVAMDAHNSFDEPHVLEPGAFNGAHLQGSQLWVAMPAKSVVVLDLH